MWNYLLLWCCTESESCFCGLPPPHLLWMDASLDPLLNTQRLLERMDATIWSTTQKYVLFSWATWAHLLTPTFLSPEVHHLAFYIRSDCVCRTNDTRGFPPSFFPILSALNSSGLYLEEPDQCVFQSLEQWEDDESSGVRRSWAFVGESFTVKHDDIKSLFFSYDTEETLAQMRFRLHLPKKGTLVSRTVQILLWQ